MANCQVNYLHQLYSHNNSDLRRIKSRQHVENLQEQAQLRLHDSILAKGPRSRFGKILLKLSLLGEVSPSFIEKCFFKGGLENVSDDFQKSPFSDENQTNEKTSSVVESNISNQSKERTDTHNKSKEINKSCNQLGEKSETHNQPAEPSIVSPVNKSTTPAEVASQSEEDAIPEHDQSKDCVDELILASIKQEEIDEIEIVIWEEPLKQYRFKCYQIHFFLKMQWKYQTVYPWG